MKKETYKANGRTFYTYDEVLAYAAENGYRVTNTQTIHHKGKTVVLCDLTTIKQ